MTGFRAFAVSLHPLISRFGSAKLPNVSARLREYSHFVETAAGDLVRSRLPPEVGSSFHAHAAGAHGLSRGDGLWRSIRVAEPSILAK
jgi:hypothetical protein